MSHTGPAWTKIGRSKVKKQTCTGCVFYECEFIRKRNFVSEYEQLCHKAEQHIGFSNDNPLNLTPAWCPYKN